MDALALIPVADALPVHWPVLLVLLVGTTFLHLIAMNVMFGTGLIAIAAPLMGDGSTSVPRTVSQTLIYATALTVNMGVAPLLFLQTLYGQFFYTSTILMAIYWLSVVILLLVTYASFYRYQLCHLKGGGLFFLGISAVAMLVMAFFFCNNISLMQMPASWLHYFDNRGGWLVNWDDSSLIPRYLHFVLSAIAAGGLTVAYLFSGQRKKPDAEPEKWVNYGLNWFTWATIANFGAGFWFLGTLPKSVVGSSAPYSGWLILLVIASVVTIIPALRAANKQDVSRAIRWTLLTVFVMTVAREIARLGFLSPYWSLADLPVRPQYSPFVLFLVVAIAVVGLLTWMFMRVRSEMEVR